MKKEEKEDPEKILAENISKTWGREPWQQDPRATSHGVQHAKVYVMMLEALESAAASEHSAVNAVHIMNLGANARHELLMAREFGVDVVKQIVSYRPPQENEDEQRNDDE